MDIESLPLDIDDDGVSDATHADDRLYFRLNRMREITLPQTGSPDDRFLLVDGSIGSIGKWIRFWHLK